MGKSYRGPFFESQCIQLRGYAISPPVPNPTRGKGKCIAVNGNPPHSYGVSLVIRDHTVLCYLPPDTSEHTPPSPQPYGPVLDLPTPEGWKAELT